MELVIHSYCLKGARQEPLLPPVSLTPTSSTLTVAELIRLTVAEQIAALSVQHCLEQAAMREVLDRQYLSERDIRRQASEGAILMPQAKASPQLDVDVEIERALKGFETRAFRVLHNGVMLQNLDDLIEVSPPSTIAFIRLMPLIGG
ncbi:MULTISPECIES: hypothetical protein [unclassified Pseudomonas]|uniref:hypothetical protein n=1 Tax=unclassified Pseudomonas TaxID=196821 RepID=UPI0005367029|nr:MULTISPECIES: hypothetical protein [unclassified Pseudomonas]MBD0687319.1 hypothetical protein [Pseudomonas sp. PSB18]CDF96328.1 hypothetical protein BN844_3895 [Pseudomonas sp. SHC52]